MLGLGILQMILRSAVFVHVHVHCAVVKQMLSEQNLTAVPVNLIFSNVTNLNLRRNDIQRLDDYTFQQFTEIRYLFLDHNNISYIANLAFHGLEKIYYLYLDHNALQELPDFSDVPSNLRFLVASYNDIRGNLTCDYLSNLASLQYLYLYKNQLDYAEFCQMNQFMYLDISYNKLTEPPKLNNALPSLRYLYIGGNPIPHIDNEYFIKTPNLQQLKLDHSDISVLPQLSNLPKLSVLQVSSTPLTTIVNVNLLSFNQLSSVGLSYTGLQDFPDFRQVAKHTQSTSLTVYMYGIRFNCSGNTLCWLKTILQ